VLLRISDVRYRRALRRVESTRMNQLLSINAARSIHMDQYQYAEIDANELCSCRRSEEFAPKMICLRLKSGRILPQQNLKNPGKTITCRGDLFKRRQSVAGDMYPEKSFFCNFCGSSKANRMTSQKPANGRLTDPSCPALSRLSTLCTCIAAGSQVGQEVVMHHNLCVSHPARHRFSLIGTNGQAAPPRRSS
jgi:hypothetical protein